MFRAELARRESDPRPVSYKDTALTTELRASGAEGSRTLTFPLKRRKRCRYATTPDLERAYPFEPSCSLHDRFLSQVVRGGVEPPPATYQIAMLPLHHRTVGKVGVEPTVSCSQGTRGAVPLHPVVLFLELARMGVEPISSP
jgi:hypothetical protein